MPWVEVNGNHRSWQHAQCGRAARAECHESGGSAAGSWRMQKVASSHGTSSEGRCRQAPRLPHRMEADASKCHACHTNSRASSATNGNQACHPLMIAISSGPAAAQRISGSAQYHKRHACHTKWRPMSPSARPATQNGGRFFQKQLQPSAPPEPAQCHKCHACHTKWRSMLPSATPTTKNGGRCFQMPRLPHKQPPRPRGQTGTKRATRASPAP